MTSLAAGLPALNFPPLNSANAAEWQDRASVLLDWMFDRQMELLAELGALDDAQAPAPANDDELGFLDLPPEASSKPRRVLTIIPPMRRSVERAIENLIGLLDTVDAHHDDDGEAEADGNDELWLGWATDQAGDEMAATNSDRELDDSDAEDAGDDEASLGFDEPEHDSNGDTGCVDDEPSLGWGEAGPPNCHFGDALGTLSGFIDYYSADLEADYVSSDGRAPCGRDADEEDNLGGLALQLRNGAIVADREGDDAGFGDNGIGDQDGLIEACGAAATPSGSVFFI